MQYAACGLVSFRGAKTAQFDSDYSVEDEASPTLFLQVRRGFCFPNRARILLTIYPLVFSAGNATTLPNGINLVIESAAHSNDQLPLLTILIAVHVFLRRVGRVSKRICWVFLFLRSIGVIYLTGPGAP